MITLFINGKEDGQYESRNHLDKRLAEISQDHPEVDLDQPVECGSMSIEVKYSTICKSCKGSGERPNSDMWEACRACGGSGENQEDDDV